ncbi:uncharacterized protein ACMZJ9_015485 isoform 1-T2 [Mantella aurantiaca]
MMEEHQTRPSRDGDATNTVHWPTVYIKDGDEETTAMCIKESSRSVDGHSTDITLYTSPEEEPYWHDKGHLPHSSDYRIVSIKEEQGSCIENSLMPEDVLSPKEHLPHKDTSPPNAQMEYASDYITEELSEDDGIITVLIKEVPHSHEGQDATSDSVTDHPSIIQPNPTSLQSEIEVIYQNPPNCTIGDIANLTRYSRAHSKRKTIQCLVCGQYFLRTAHLVAHEVTHPEKCTVSCAKCGQAFPSTADLLVHRKTHRPETLFLCLECGRCYRCRGQLVLHQRRHLRENSLASM